MSARGVLRIIPGDRLAFWCPGCKETHSLDLNVWRFDGNYEAPTFLPSVKVTSGHFAEGHKPGDGCWCTYAKEYGEAPYKCRICHSFVEAGMIRFLTDSTHELAGQTVKLEAF